MKVLHLLLLSIFGCALSGLHSLRSSAFILPLQQAGEFRQSAFLKASNARPGSQFGGGGPLLGDSIALSSDGNTLAVGAPMETSASRGIAGNQHDESAFDAGAVYVFTRTGTSWKQQAYVKASNARAGSHFGYVVRLSGDGDTMAVSAYFESSGAKGINGSQNDQSIPQAGAVYVFARSGGTWNQQAYIKASNTGEAGKGDEIGDGDQFGFSVAISDDGHTIAVGAITEDSAGADQADNSMQSAGAVYVFTRTGRAWTQQAYIKPSNPGAGDLFGHAVSLSADGSTLAVGSFDEDGPAEQLNGSGALYVFRRSGTTWVQEAYLQASNAEIQDALGASVAVSLDGNTLVAGSLDEDCLCTGANPKDSNGALAGANDRALDNSSGAVYVFVRNNGAWTQQAYLKASNTGKEDWFGSRLALSGDGNTIAIGAQLEDGPNDPDQEAGAVYVFTRSGDTWTQRQYLKGSNTKAFDEFGSSISVNRDGRLIMVGARNEGNEAGAVYAFSR